jgi:HAD superfamily hydrolase (TIGR01509 family)
MPLRALIFDFDGLLVDTESPSYAAWREPFTERQVELELGRWLQVVGTHDTVWDPVSELEQLTGETLDRAALVDEVNGRYHTLAHEQPTRDGVLALLEQAREAGLGLAIASSSRHTWVRAHLERLGLLDRFDAVVGRDLVGWRGKPAPDVYVEALRRLGVGAGDAVALEDSSNGVRSAVGAGVAVIAVPNPITQGLEFPGAAAVLDSLAGVTLADLQRLVGWAASTEA